MLTAKQEIALNFIKTHMENLNNSEEDAIRCSDVECGDCPISRCSCSGEDNLITMFRYIQTGDIGNA